MIVLYPYEVGDGVCVESTGPRGSMNVKAVYPPGALKLLFLLYMLVYIPHYVRLHKYYNKNIIIIFLSCSIVSVDM